MGLLNALSTAVTGLNVNQKNLSVLSQNIANANTANYSTQVVNQQATFIGGDGSGVSVASITRSVDEFLTAEVQSQTSVNSAASTTQSYYSQIQNLLGTPGAANSIDQTINNFFSTLQTLANNPTVSAETTAVNAGVTLASKITGLATALQNLRAQADSQISSAVTSVNNDLKSLSDINNALERASATHQSTTGLLDERDKALADIAQYIDIKPTYEADGSVNITTGNGLTLLSSSTLSQLTYTPATSVQSFINNGALSPIQVTTVDDTGRTVSKPVTLVTGGPSGTVTTSLVSGKIQSLLSVRDSVIPNILSQLDLMASNLRDGMNAITNAGTSFPPPNSYTGDRPVNASAATQYSGSIQIAVLDGSGNPLTSPYADETNGLAPITLNLGTMTGSGGTGILSTDNIINAINQAYGTPQNKTELGNLNNVQLGVISNNIPDAGNTLSFDFNLNNISGGQAPFFVSGVTLLDNTGAPVSGSTVTSTQPKTAITSYTASAANTVMVNTTGANTYTDGQTIYLNTPSTTVGGQALTAGYYTVSNATGTSFDITLAGATAGGGAQTPSSAATSYPPVTAADSGATLRTGANGTFSVTGLTSGPSVPFYTVQANIATVDSNGNLVTSTVSYRVSNNASGTLGNLVGASSATGSATLVSPSSTQPLVTATLVDANGNPLPKTNGTYGNQQGYLKITANNSSYTVAVNQLDSKQIGLQNQTPAVAGTNLGFSSYFGLNNFFNSNKLTATGDTVSGSALNLSVQSRIVGNPALISIGTLSQSTQSTNPNAQPNFTYRMSPGDNSISQKLAALGTNALTFTVAGGMPPSSTTLSQYAGQIIAKTSSDSTTATNTANDSQTLLTGFTTRAQSVSGVNLDQELANTVIYQNAYTASTRVISVVSSMFQELLGILG